MVKARGTQTPSLMLTVFLSLGTPWTLWDSIYFMLFFKKVNLLGAKFYRGGNVSLILAEGAKMKGSPLTL